MGVGLVLAARVQQSGSSRQRGRHINHLFARGDELLRQQRAMASRSLDRPQPRRERHRPFQQPLSLTAISADRHLADNLLVVVDGRGRV
jgi:hypothetical protein